MQDLGSTIPTCYGNVSMDVHYKNCSLWMSGDYQTGSYVHSFDRQFRFQKGLKDDVVPQTALMGRKQKDAWLDFTNYFVEKADFFKVRNVGLSYLYHLKGSKPVVKSVLFSMSVNNPLNFTAASVDPEAVISGAHSQGGCGIGRTELCHLFVTQTIYFLTEIQFVKSCNQIYHIPSSSGERCCWPRVTWWPPATSRILTSPRTIISRAETPWTLG